MLIYEVRQIRRPERVYGVGKSYEHRTPAARWSTISARCVDSVACKARWTTAYEKRRKRSGNLRWAQSRFESPNIDLPKGSCRWCGEPIVFVDDVPYRYKRRERHRGDEWEVGDGRNCRREHNRTFAATPRDLIMHRGDPCCVDCGEAEVWVQPEEGEGYWLPGDWEADHVIPVEDGGPHTPTNICRRCVPCHRAKTNRENAERRRRRELDKAQAQA
jgi:5-methylcytosine-specific restriction protein A